jgi:o-succinylbenzoate synthase
MYKASLHPHQLQFNHPGGTSRGVLSTKMSYYIHIWKEAAPEVIGRGECSILPGLSPDDRPQLEAKLQWCCQSINALIPDFHQQLLEWPAIRFALEMALADLLHGGRGIYYPSDFTSGQKEIPINGLIWMGNAEEMSRRIDEKLEEGFSCLKLKIGALNFDSEIQLIKALRKRFSPQTLELRVDANGAFSPQKAPEVLDQLAQLAIHSIEQPIKAGQWQQMAQLCATTPIPIALDEELIGLADEKSQQEMITTIRPQYIILKPSLTGGFLASENWIKHAETVNAGWWITSALEANIGLNAISQWTATLNNPMPQGLGTGQVFSNNVNSPLIVERGKLRYQTPSA